jgi:hypothetical protein
LATSKQKNLDPCMETGLQRKTCDRPEIDLGMVGGTTTESWICHAWETMKIWLIGAARVLCAM